MDRVRDVARWSEDAGCEGILVYTDNSLADPWLVAQTIISNTTDLSPLVAIQPIYRPPYSVAKLISTLGFLYGRRVWLNMLAGGFKNDLLALSDDTPHDRRYDRMVEYTTVISRFLREHKPLFYEGEFYRINGATLNPPLDPALVPGILVSGSSAAGMRAAAALGATAVQYPRPASELETEEAPAIPVGIRVGIIARDDAAHAWRVAHERFPTDRRGEVTHNLAMKVSDSKWHRQLSEMGEAAESQSVYWLVPFENYKTFCPYLVGDYDEVATELARYLNLGYQTLILDVPASAEELGHIAETVDRAGRVGST
jgi:alkanesulfonate monooxygenase